MIKREETLRSDLHAEANLIRSIADSLQVSNHCLERLIERLIGSLTAGETVEVSSKKVPKNLLEDIGESTGKLSSEIARYYHLLSVLDSAIGSRPPDLSPSQSGGGNVR